NSVQSGPNSYMTLSYEPIAVKSTPEHEQYQQENQALNPPSYYQQNRQQSQQQYSQSYFHQGEASPDESYNSQQNVASPESPKAYQAQAIQTLPPVNSIEDQQEPPHHTNKFNYADTYGRRGLHQQPVKASTQHHHQSETQQKSYHSQQPISSYSQPTPEWQQQAPPEKSQHAQSKVSFYRTFERKKPVDQNHSQQSHVSQQQHQYYPQQAPSPNFQLSQENAQASEVEPVQKFDWEQNIQRYAKEFGFELPSSKAATEASQPQKDRKSVV